MNNYEKIKGNTAQRPVYMLKMKVESADQFQSETKIFLRGSAKP